MELFLIADIFGKTLALESFLDDLSRSVADASIIDPYHGVDHGFETESCAYDYFTSQVGLKKYQSILADRLTAPGPDAALIGFSVGASAIWGISHQSSLIHIRQAFCFYGSRIRHHIDILPRFNIKLYFPRHEPHFNVDNLITHLQTIPLVSCIKANGRHGFMNEASPGFHPGLYADFLEYLRTTLNQL